MIKLQLFPLCQKCQGFLTWLAAIVFYQVQRRDIVLVVHCGALVVHYYKTRGGGLCGSEQP